MNTFQGQQLRSVRNFDDRKTILWRRLGLQDYLPILEAMQRFTDSRDTKTPDEIWTLEHPQIYTLGQAGNIRHVVAPGLIPVLRTDRGGQVTYHGPGQIVVYILYDLRRGGINIKTMVWCLEQAVIDCLMDYDIVAARRSGAPGVYVSGRKIASLGLRVRNSRIFHGLSLNCAMDLDPFRRIHPCGDSDLEMTQIADVVSAVDISQVERTLVEHLAIRLDCTLSIQPTLATGIAKLK